MTIKKDMIMIQNRRHRLSSIKIYEPTIDAKNMSRPGISIALSVDKKADKYVHRFNSEIERNLNLEKLDNLLLII